MPRAYRKTGRAAAAAETRRRIVDAAVGLHMSIGPAWTTGSAIAERAGVQRLTVYRHFPDQESLFRACVAHGWTSYPPPDHRAWAREADPERRLRLALTELYAYYDEVGDALGVILRDLPRVPQLAALNAPHLAHWERMRETLEHGWGARSRRRRALRAALSLSLDLTTWDALVRRVGLSREEAVELMVRTVRCA
jgi:AcrR family transcriptional regulator